MRKGILGFARGVLRTTPFKRRAFFLLADVALIVFALRAAFWLRFDGQVPDIFSRYLLIYSLLALAVKLGFLMYSGQYNISWRFYSLDDLMKLVRALAFSSLTIAFLMFFLKSYVPFRQFPRSVLLVDFILAMGLISGLRIAKRAVREYRFWTETGIRGRTRILIIGAGQAGEQICREMLNNRKSKYFPTGYVDDDPAKQGISIHGIKVLGKRADIPEILKSRRIDEVLVAIPSADSKDVRNIVETIRKASHVKSIKILPGIMAIMDGVVALSDIQDIQVEDLLGREAVAIDYEALRQFLSGKRILITGAGGSIGGELARTVLLFEPKKLALLDIDETELFDLMNRLKPLGFEVEAVVGDIRDRAKMARLFQAFRPEIVIHSAAYKHVPILESYPEEAVKNNVLGTKILGELALANGVEKFVNISTDKAINPTSIMGATKRVAEEFLRILNGRNETRFISVRFGNVLGSRGSVIPLFKEQIRKGGPVTVTHPDMKRYFMAPAEAVLLVLAAAAAGQGGGTFVLDMGEPVKIVDLARDMIRLSGHAPDVDIPIVYIGLRPGEKLFEELLGAEEGSDPTEHAKIFRARNSRMREEEQIVEAVDRLIALCAEGCRREDIIGVLKEIVPTFNANGDGPTAPCRLDKGRAKEEGAEGEREPPLIPRTGRSRSSPS